jgi:hypothetical protein
VIQEDPNFHQYLRSEVEGTTGLAVLGDPVDAAQFQINNGQLEQLVPGGTILYATVQPPANSSAVKLAVSWTTTPDTLGSFVWGGDTVEWSSPTVSRPQNNVRRSCPHADVTLRHIYQSPGMVGLSRCSWQQTALP